MKRDEEIERLKAELKAAKDALKLSNKMLDQYKQTVSEQKSQIASYKVIVDAFKENYGLQKLLNFVSKSERLSSSQIKNIIKELNKTDSKDKIDDIAECTKHLNSSKEEEPKDLEKYSKEVEVKTIRIKNKIGRQPNTKTRGRDLSGMAFLDKVIHEDDLMKSSEYSDEFKKSLKFFRVTERNRLVYVRGFVKHMVVRTYYYKDGKGKLYKSNSSLNPDIMKGGKISNSVIASTATDKVLWASPLNAQAKRINIISGANIVNSQLLSRSFLEAAKAITPVWERVLSYIKSQEAIHGDESRLLVVRNEDKGGAALGQMWSLSYSGKNNPACYFKFYTNRRKDCVKELYSDCKGIALQTDGYSAYASVINDINSLYMEEVRKEYGEEEAENFLNDCNKLAEEGILLVGCMAHARRLLVQAVRVYADLNKKDVASICNECLEIISKIYEIERRLRASYDNGELTEDEFVAKRKAEVEGNISLLKEKANKYLSSKLADTNPLMKKAFTYLKNQIGTISNYLYSSELTPDNNFQERQFRPLAATRRACLFASSEKGALAWSKLLSILQTAVLNNVDPTLYLKYLLDEIARMDRADILLKDVDWTKYLPWNVDKEILKKVWDK